MTTTDVAVVPTAVAPAGVPALRRRVPRRYVGLLGPAFVAAVAYVDPGNVATNSAAGARYGYLLVWVVVVANAMAMLVQTLSAKLGLATGRSLPELCRERCSRPVTRLMWAQAELVAAATDVAEVVGGAVGLSLLTGVPLFTAGMLVAAVSFGVLVLRSRGARHFEVAIGVMLAVVMGAFLATATHAGLHAGLLTGMVPRFSGGDSVLLGAGILGATVMPHVVYAHSALTRDRYAAADERQRRTALRGQRLDVLLALGCAGLTNLAMLLLGTIVPAQAGGQTLAGVYAGLRDGAGAVAAAVFGTALLVSGLASTSVGTYAGEIIMAGFLRRRVPLPVRRLVTVVPALVILGAGTDPTTALVLSQVMLSFGIPFALLPLIVLTRRRDVMGELVNHRATTVAAVVVAAFVVALNGVLIAQLR